MRDFVKVKILHITRVTTTVTLEMEVPSHVADTIVTVDDAKAIYNDGDFPPPRRNQVHVGKDEEWQLEM